MAKKKPIRTHDGKPVRVGMKVWKMYTKDAGKTWLVGLEQRVVECDRKFRTVTLMEPFSTMMLKENRIFSSEAAAIGEAKKRFEEAKKREKEDTDREGRRRRKDK